MNNIKINKIDIPQFVKIRKHEANINELQLLLKNHKKIVNLTNKDISNQLNIKKTTVDHWFRCDSSFSIPDENIWYELKRLLNITTDKFDKFITEFEWKIGTYEKSERCYFTDGLAPTITCSDDIKILV